MIDLHCHLLPGIDDGAPDLETALAMARCAVADGIAVTACTPHQMPGYYENAGPAVRGHAAAFQRALDEAGIPLRLVTGADVHLVPDLGAGLRSGRLLTLADSRYFLFEPPHNIAPPHMDRAVFDVMALGYHPIVTHPERLRWIEENYVLMRRLVEGGAWMQITAGSLTGRFGVRARYWAERMLDEGLVHILATDAHNMRNRKPVLSEAVEAASLRLGEAAARDMVFTRPQAVLDDADPSSVPLPARVEKPIEAGGFFRRLFGG